VTPQSLVRLLVRSSARPPSLARLRSASHSFNPPPFADDVWLSSPPPLPRDQSAAEAPHLTRILGYTCNSHTCLSYTQLPSPVPSPVNPILSSIPTSLTPLASSGGVAFDKTREQKITERTRCSRPPTSILPPPVHKRPTIRVAFISLLLLRRDEVFRASPESIPHPHLPPPAGCWFSATLHTPCPVGGSWEGRKKGGRNEGREYYKDRSHGRDSAVRAGVRAAAVR